MQLPQVRPQDLRKVRNLGHGADRRAGRLDAVALLDGDGGWNALDAVHRQPLLFVQFPVFVLEMMPELFPIHRHDIKVRMRPEFAPRTERPIRSETTTGSQVQTLNLDRYSQLSRKKCEKELENVLIWE